MGSIHYLDNNIRYLYASEGENILLTIMSTIFQKWALFRSTAKFTFADEISSKFVFDIILGSFAHFYDLGNFDFHNLY